MLPVNAVIRMVSDLSMMVEHPEKAGIVLKRLCAECPTKIWPLAPIILKFLPNTLDPNVSRYIQGELSSIFVNFFFLIKNNIT